MSTNVPRSHVTNDSGTPDAPAGDGTLWTEEELQEIYNNIDDALAGNLDIGGVLTATGTAGSHGISAAGNTTWGVRNTAAGTGNFSQFALGNDGMAVAADLAVTSTTWTNSGALRQDAFIVRGSRVGGISIFAAHASGDVRVYTRGASTPNLTIGADLTSNLSTYVVNASPRFGLFETDQGTDGKNWFLATESGTFYLQLVNDAFSNATNAIAITRSGILISAFEFAATLTPNATLTHNLGSPTRKWNTVYAGVFTTEDVRFDNGWTATEHDRVGIATPGIAWLDANEELRMFVDDRGCVYVNDVRSLAELTWTKTTKAEREALSQRLARERGDV